MLIDNQIFDYNAPKNIKLWRRDITSSMNSAMVKHILGCVPILGVYILWQISGTLE